MSNTGRMVWPEELRKTLGGVWPELKGFNFDQVAYFKVGTTGILTPMDKKGAVIPGRFRVGLFYELLSMDKKEAKKCRRKN